MNLNKVILCGRLTRDPELKALPSGIKVANFSLVTNSFYKDAAGINQEQAEFHNITVFGKIAENCAAYLKKGQEVMIEGKIQTRSWDDKVSGEKKYRTEIIADSVQFGAPSKSEEGSTPKKTTRKPDLEKIPYPEEDLNPDDIPF